MKHKRLSAILSAVLMLPAMLQFSMPASAAKVKTLGDVNADGTVNISDGVALSRYVAKWDGITIDKDAADLNQDGEIKKEDVTILLRYLVGWDGYDKQIISWDAADLDGDGKVTAKDKAIINRYLAGWTGYDEYFE